MGEMALKLNIEFEIVRVFYKKKHKTIQSTMKKFKTANLAPATALNLLVSNSSCAEEPASNPTSSPFININSHLQQQQQQQHHHPHRLAQNKCLTQLSANAIINNANSNGTVTPVKQIMSAALTADQLHTNLFKAQTPAASSYSLSSPSAAILFGMNSNSFSVPSEIQFNVTSSRAARHNAKSQSSEQHAADNKENKPENQSVNFGNNTSVSFIDDAIIDAFMNDISYDFIQK
jgi:hypothetical protein